MASTYSSSLALELIGTGEQAGTWGTTTNTNLGTLIDQAIAGYEIYTCTGGTDTITIPNGATGVARNMFLELTGTGGGSLVVPTNKKLYFIYNNTSAAITVKVTTGVSVPAGAKTVLVCNGTDIVVAVNYLASFSAPSGSSLIGFLQSGTGAVARTVQSKERDTISVKDFGAVGDGVIDDTAAIQACLDANPTAEIDFGNATNNYKCTSSIILVNASGKDFQGTLVGRGATITFTNAGAAADTDANMQKGFYAYPKTNGALGDATGSRQITIDGLKIIGPLHGAGVYLANSVFGIIRNNSFTTNRYGIALECTINMKVLYNTFDLSTNANLGLIMSSNSSVWYGSATPQSSYWNDSPLIMGNQFGHASASGTLACILDMGSQSEGIRTITSNLFIGAGTAGVQYAYIGRNCQPSFHGNWTEQINYPVRLLSTNAVEPGNITGVTGAEPSGTYNINLIPDGYSYRASVRDNDFVNGLIDIGLSGLVGPGHIGGNRIIGIQNTGTHILSVNSSNQMVIDHGEILVNAVGTYTFKNFLYNTYFDLAYTWSAGNAVRWVSWTPTVTALVGALTSYTVNAAKYRMIRNDLIAFKLDITITNTGTGSVAIVATTPTPPPAFPELAGVLIGQETVGTGNSLIGRVDGAAITITFYNNTYPGATNNRMILTGVVEASFP